MNEIQRAGDKKLKLRDYFISVALVALCIFVWILVPFVLLAGDAHGKD